MPDVTYGDPVRIGRDGALALCAVFLAATVGVAAVDYPTVVVAGLALAFGLPLLAALFLPKRLTLAPWRIALPPLVAYTAISLALEQPGSTDTQYRWLLLYCLSFIAGSIASHLVWSAGLPPAAGDTSAPLRVNHACLLTAQSVGLLIFASSVARTGGIPALSGDAAAARVELAAPGVAGIGAIGTALLQLVLIIDLLAVGKVVRIEGHRLAAANIVLVTLLLLSSSGRSDLMRPLVIAGLAMLLSGWRRLGYILAGVVGAFGLFLVGGILRDGNDTALGPALAYLLGTAQTNDHIDHAFPGAVPHPGGELFFWFLERFSGHSAIPPGIYLKELFNRTEFVGFGLETNVLGALWIDWGTAGLLVGGLLIGGLAHFLYLRWRTRRGWWLLGYATALTYLLLQVVNHPIASYWFLIFPACLAALWAANRNALAVSDRQERARPDKILQRA